MITVFFDDIDKFVNFMSIKNIRFVFTFCFGLVSLLAISGSQGEESAQHSQVWVAVNHQSSQESAVGISDVPSFFQYYLSITKQFLKSEIRMLEELSIGNNYVTPQVIVDLPPVTPKISRINKPQSGEVIKLIVPTEKVVPVSEQNPILIGPNSALGPENISFVKLKKEVTLKQKDSLKGKRPALGPLRVKKGTEKKDRDYMQGKVKVALSQPGASLMLGLSLKLGMSHQGNENSCVIKKNGYVHFCAQTIKWPDHIKALFKTNGNLYQGTQAIGRYDGKKLSHIHATFFETGLREVILYLENRFGPPAEILYNTVAPFEGTPRENPTFIWREKDYALSKGKNVNLEVRRFNDVVGGFPDMKHGFIRLYADGALPIFPQVNSSELMLVKYLAQRR